MTAFAASAIVRTFNSAETVEATLASLRRQSLPVEIIIVDSGSRDATLDIAEPYTGRIVEIAHEEFSFGRALNCGAAAATTPVHVALSSHCALPRGDWISIARSHIVGDGAVAACGGMEDADGRRLEKPLKADHEYLRRNPNWGFTNHASAWAATAWEGEPFDEELIASEDKEWTWRATSQGGYVVVDPDLLVPNDHRRKAGARGYYQRLLKEITAIGLVTPLPRYSLRSAVTDWLRRNPSDPFLTNARRLGRTRFIETAARWRAGSELPEVNHGDDGADTKA